MIETTWYNLEWRPAQSDTWTQYDGHSYADEAAALRRRDEATQAGRGLPVSFRVVKVTHREEVCE